MIIKIYHIFTIDIIQITDRRIQIERERERERERESRMVWTGLKLTKSDWMDWSRQSEPKCYVDVTQ